MRILISGGCGFIGSNLVTHLADMGGFHITVVDDMSNGHFEFLMDERQDPRFRPAALLQKDFADPFILNKIREQEYDYVVHLAAVPRVSYSVEHPLKTHDVNVTRTLQLMDACRGNVERFVFASSSSVYGGADVLPTPETHPKNPKSPYALQKSIIEDYLTLYHDLYGLDSISLRFFNVFGKNALGDSPYSTAVSAWLSAVRRGLPLRSDGDGSQTRDMCHVDNVVRAIELAMATHLKGARRYNVATGVPVSNTRVLHSLLMTFPNAIVQPAPWRPGDVMHTHADITTIRQELGFIPDVDFWTGLEKTIEWAMNSDLFLNLRSDK